MLLGLAVLLLVAAWLGPRALLPALLRRASDGLGVEIRAESVSGNALFGFELRGVEVEGIGDRPLLRSAAASRLRFRYDLLRLLLGRGGWLRSVEGAELEADLDLQGEVPGGFRGSESGDRSRGPWTIPRLDLDVTRVRLESGEATLRVEDLQARYAPSGRGAGVGFFALARGEWSLGPETRPVPDLAGRIVRDGPRLTVSEIVSGGRTHREDRVAVDLPEGPSGAIAIDARLSVVGGRFEGNAAVAESRIEGTISLEDADGETLRRAIPADLPDLLGRFDLQGTFEAGGDAPFRAIVARVDGGLDPGRIAARGALEITVERGGIDFTAGNLEIVSSVPLDAAGTIDGTVRLTVASGSPKFEGHAAMHDVRLGLTPDLPEIVGLAANVRIDDRSLIIDEARATVEGARWSGSGELVLGESGLPEARGVRLRGEGVAISDWGRRLGSDFAGEGTVEILWDGPLDTPSLEARASATGVRVGGSAEMETSVVAHLDAGRLRFDSIALRSGSANVAARGEIPLALSIHPFHVEIDASGTSSALVEFEGLDSETLASFLPQGSRPEAEARGASGSIALSGSLAAPRFSIATVANAVDVLEEGEPFQASVRAEIADGRLRVSEAKIIRAGTEVEGTLGGPLRVDLMEGALRPGELAQYTGSFSFVVSDLRMLEKLPGPWGTVTGEAELEGGVLHARRVRGSLGERGTLSLEGTMSLDDRFRPVAFEALGELRAVDLAESGLRLEDRGLVGRATLFFEAGGTLQEPRAAFELRAVDVGAADAPEARIDGLLARGTLDSGGLAVTDLIAERHEGVLTGFGWVGFPLSLDPLRAEVGVDSPFSFEIDADSVPVARLLRGYRRLRRVDGTMSMNLQGDGTLGSPSLEGYAGLEGVTVRFEEESLPRLENLRGEIRVDHDRMTLRNVTALLGKEEIQIEGESELDGWKVASFRTRIHGERLLLQSADNLRVRADVNLTHEGTPEGSLFRGTIVTADSRYLGDIALGGGNGSTREARLRTRIQLPVPEIGRRAEENIRLDVQVRTGEPILVDTNVVRGHARPELRLIGTAADPILVGSIVLEDGEVFTPTADFDVDLAKVEFFEQDPLRPYVRFVGKTRIGGYDIVARARGPADDLELTFSSSPALSQEDIASVIATGVPREELVGEGAQKAARSQGFRLLYNQVFPRKRGKEADLFSEISDRITVEALPARTPVSAGPIVRAQARITDEELLFVRGEVDDEFGEYTLDLVVRFSFGKRRSDPEPEEGAVDR